MACAVDVSSETLALLQWSIAGFGTDVFTTDVFILIYFATLCESTIIVDSKLFRRLL